MKRRTDIQVYRGISVLAVLFFHFARSIFPNGYLGVDVFFVISGFVVTPLILRTIQKNEEDNENPKIIFAWGELASFYSKRFLRLFPSLGAALVFTVAVSYLFIPQSLHQRIGMQAFLSLLTFGNFGAVKFSGDYFSPEPNPLIHLWSLGVEEQYYILFPICIFLGIFIIQQLGKGVRTLLPISLILFIILIYILEKSIISIMNIAQTSDFTFYATSTHAWQFILGGITFLMHSFIQKKLIRPNVLRVSAFAILSLTLFLPYPVKTPLAVLIASFGIAILLGLVPDRRFEFVSWRPLVWLGNRSYPIYLIHMPLVWIAKYSTVFQGYSDNLQIYVLIGSFLLTLGLGHFLYSTVEKPYRQNSGNALLQKRMVGSNLIFLIIVMLAVQFMIQLTLEKQNNSDFNFRQSYIGLVKKLEPCQSDANKSPSCEVRFGSGDKLVLVIGDSHAHHLLPGLGIVARANQWKLVVWAQSACQFQLTKSENISAACISNNRRIINWIELNRPNRIILSQYVKEDSEIAGLTDGLRKLKSPKSELAVIENSPVFPDQNDFMVEKPLIQNWINGEYRAPTEFRMNQMDISADKRNKEFISAARALRINVISIDSVFCKAQICNRKANSSWLYKDSNHLSIEGSLRVGDYLAQTGELKR